MIPEKRLDLLMKEWRKQTLIDLDREAAVTRGKTFETEYPLITAVMEVKLAAAGLRRQAA